MSACAAPRLREMPPPTAVRAVALLLHGGREHGRDPVDDASLTVRRMQPFAHAVAARGAMSGVAVWQLRYRARGWNGDGAGPVADADWALEEVGRRHDRVPVVILGHSMGARTALRVAGHPAVRGVVGLAPWLPDGEPVAQLVDRTVVLLHGRWDRTTSRRGSLTYARRAAEVSDRVCRLEVLADAHAMLLRARRWHDLAAGSVMGALDLDAFPSPVARALTATTDREKMRSRV